MSLALRWGDPNKTEEPSGFIYLDAPLKSDDNSGRSFGLHGQITIVGWLGKDKSGKKVYIVECSICKQDSELFGYGVFKTSLSNLNKGQTPCGCSKKPIWSEHQYLTLLKRELTGEKYSVIELSEEYQGAKTKVKFLCPQHGFWENNGNAVFNGQRCPVCANNIRVEKLKEHNTKPDSYFLEMIMSRGEHPAGTKLEKVSRNNWNYYCPLCDDWYKMTYSTLSKGGKSCNCSKFNPKQAYIRLMKDGDIPVAIKFGVSNYSEKRNYKNTDLQYETLSVWEFPNRDTCLAAERECKISFVCGIIPKYIMPDGYTETTSVYNLDMIIEIYSKFGGVEV